MSRKIRFSKESQSSLNDFFVHRSPEQPKSKAEENLPAGILSAFRTDVGKVRANNQDAPIVSEKLRLYGVADGMGGHKGGEVASTSARDDLLRELEGKTPSVAALSGAIEEVNRQIYHQQEHDDALTGMGTTLVAALILKDTAVIINVGDSRAYLFTAEGVQLLTTDHSIVEFMVQRGELTQEQAKNHPGKNVITRAVGTEPSVEGDIYIQKLHRDDCLLLCSDGLSNVMADQEMLFEVVHGMSKSDCCQRLLRIAKNRGAPDNVTVAMALV